MARPRKIASKEAPKSIQFKSILDAIDTHSKAVDGFRMIHEARENPGDPEKLGSIGIVSMLSRYSLPRVFQLIDSGVFSEAELVKKAASMDEDMDLLVDNLLLALIDQFETFDRKNEEMSDPSTGRKDGILGRRCEMPVRELVCLAVLLHLLDRTMARRFASNSMPRRRHSDSEVAGYRIHKSDIVSRRSGSVAMPDFHKLTVDYIMRNDVLGKLKIGV